MLTSFAWRLRSRLHAWNCKRIQLPTLLQGFVGPLAIVAIACITFAPFALFYLLTRSRGSFGDQWPTVLIEAMVISVHCLAIFPMLDGIDSFANRQGRSFSITRLLTTAPRLSLAVTNQAVKWSGGVSNRIVCPFTRSGVDVHLRLFTALLSVV